MKTDKALLIVDVQNDFCPGGALGVPGGDRIIPLLNRYIKIFTRSKLPVFASRDWHSLQSSHFRDFGGVWPVHCVRMRKGARFHPGLHLSRGTIVLSKGMDPSKEGYSAFEASDRKGRGFLSLLRLRRVKHLYIGGLATDYCVRATVLDALEKGFSVTLLKDAVKGVNRKPHDAKKAIVEMTGKGAQVTTVGRMEEERCLMK